MSISLYQITLHTKNYDIKNVKSVFHLPVTISLISNYAHGTLMPFFTTMKWQSVTDIKPHDEEKSFTTLSLDLTIRLDWF